MQSRTFLITGASKGIGRALANHLTQQGHHVVGLARTQGEGKFPGDFVSVDLTNRDETENTLKLLTRQYRFDGVVNNLGFVKLGKIGEIKLDEVEDLFSKNLMPAIQTVQALLPQMREQGWGRIVNLSSLTVLGVTNRTAYAGSKSALASFTRTWALELAETGITVNTVAPGPVETEMFRINSPAGSEAEQKFLSLIPMKRLGRPEELAATIAFVLSDDAAFMTGQTLYVDGGGSIGKSAA